VSPFLLHEHSRHVGLLTKRKTFSFLYIPNTEDQVPAFARYSQFYTYVSVVLHNETARQDDAVFLKRGYSRQVHSTADRQIFTRSQYS
jgi:hypothetical protein